MPKQPAFPGLCDAMQKQQTRWQLFQAEMDAAVPWDRLLIPIEPRFAGGAEGRHRGAAERVDQTFLKC